MRCEKCNRKEAHVVLRHEQAEKKTLHLCEQCAIASSNIDASANGPVGVDREMLKTIKEYPLVVNAVYQTQCAKCHLTYTAFKHLGRIGCSECLKSFGNKLIKDLQLKQKYSKHTGDSPEIKLEAQAANVKELSALNRALSEAVEHEDYVEAASLRDRIRDLKSQGGHHA